MINYQVYYFKEEAPVEGKEPELKHLGFQKFQYFPELKVTKEAKAFLLARGPQKDATKLRFDRV